MDYEKLNELYQNKSKEELIEIINSSKYTDKAKLVAISVLDKRGHLNADLLLIKENIVKKEKDEHYHIRSLNKYKTFWPRFFSAILDGIAISILGLLLNMFFYITELTDFIEFALSLTPYIYSIYMHKTYGQTIGKMLLGVTVYDKDERTKINFKQALLRDIIPLSFIILLYFTNNHFTLNMILSSIGLIWTLLEMITMLASPKNRALHDYISGTIVLKN